MVSTIFNMKTYTKKILSNTLKPIKNKFQMFKLHIRKNIYKFLKTTISVAIAHFVHKKTENLPK